MSLGSNALSAGSNSTLGAVGGWLSKSGGAMGALGTAAEIVASAAALASVAAILGVIAGGIYGIVTNFHGVTDFMMDAFDRLRDMASVLGDSLSKLFGIGTPGGDVLDIFKTALPLALSTVADGLTLAIEGFLILARVIGQIVDAIEQGRVDQLTPSEIMKTFALAKIDVEADQQEATVARLVSKIASWTLDRAVQGKAEVNQDFRGSHFTIDQQFAEGYEPDRILTAFTHDLAGLGERGGQSPFAPNAAVGRGGG